MRSRPRPPVPAKWFTSPINEDWQQSLLVTLEAGRLVVAELRITPRAKPSRSKTERFARFLDAAIPSRITSPPPGGLTGTLVRRARVSAALIAGQMRRLTIRPEADFVMEFAPELADAARARP